MAGYIVNNRLCRFTQSDKGDEYLVCGTVMFISSSLALGVLVDYSRMEEVFHLSVS